MKTINLADATSWFQILHTTSRSQTAVMTLAPGGESSEKMNVHAASDQAVLVVEGAIRAEVGGVEKILRLGDTCIIPAGTLHRLAHTGEGRAVTFNVYSPPEYPAGEKG